MIIPDINLLIYAHNEDAPEHSAAMNWWRGLLGGSEAVGLPWVVSTGFVRVISNPMATPSPLSASAAIEQVASWLAHTQVMAINPGANHLEYFRRNLAIPNAGTNLVPDAHIAALAMEYDAEVHSTDRDFTDRDFGRFPGVRWRNPLA
jgi:toxin-antitoxin system PIN domain toxin